MKLPSIFLACLILAASIHPPAVRAGDSTNANDALKKAIVNQTYTWEPEGDLAKRVTFLPDGAGKNTYFPITWRIKGPYELEVGLANEPSHSVIVFKFNYDFTEYTATDFDGVHALKGRLVDPDEGRKAAGAAAAEIAEIEPVHGDWKLVWEDDFSKDGGKIDSKKWGFKIDGSGNGNNEMQYYTDDPKNARIENGVLVISALKEDKEWAHYTSAKLETKGLYSVQYGRIEACIKVPAPQAGNWPAFWMMPDEPSPYGGWPSCGEIDILEMINGADKLYGTMHYGSTWRDMDGAHVKAPNGDFSTDYHVYAIEWEKNQFRMYLDGKPYGKLDKWWTPGHEYPAPFNQKFFIILNLALGGDWATNTIEPRRQLPDPDAKFPLSMDVKWVRVYQPPAK